MAEYLYILMKDVYGEKTPGKIMSVIAGSKAVQVLRGELLAPLHSRQRVQRYDGRPPHNYYTTRDPSVTLYGVETDISPIIGGDLQLLEAIEKPWDRFSVFSEGNKLEWGGRLKRGDQVYVRLPGDNASAPTWSAGVVRHVGPVESLPGRNFGVEIKDSRCLGKGSSDGFFGGYSYFECDQDCGLFVSLDKLATKPPHQVPHSAIHQQPKNFTLPVASLQTDPNAHTVVNPPAQGSSVDKYPRFKINDRVVVYNKKNVAMHGIVRWTGMIVQTKTLNTNHIGIETDWAAATNLFPKTLTGITHLFKTTPGHRLVVPEHLVFREELAITHTPPAQDVDLSDPAAAAREEGVSKKHFMAEQERALKDAEEAKRKEAKRKEKARKAVEEKARKAAEEKAAEEKTKKAAEEKARKENRGSTSNLELREVKSALELDESINLSAQKEALKVFEEAKKKEQDLAEQGIENQIQKQHSWHPGSDSTYETIPDDGIRPNPVPRHNRQNEGATANSVNHETAHQQQGGPGGYPPTYPHPSQDQDPHRNIGQTHDSRYPSQQGNTRPEGIQPPQPQQRDMRRVNSHNQMAPQNSCDSDYANTGEFWGQNYADKKIVDQYSSQRNGQLNQPLQENQWQGNPLYPQQPGAEHYQNMGQYQAQPSGQEFGSYPNTIHPPLNNQAHGNPPHHDTPPGGHHRNIPSQVPQEYNASVGSSNPYNLAVGSTVQVATINPNEPPHYGVIRWTGRVAGVDGQVAGIELEDYMDGCTDGTFITTGEKHFTCAYRKGLYFPLATLRPDERFGLQAGHAATSLGNPIQVPMDEQTDQFINEATEQMMRYIGNSRGIQGHQNSCYLDSTIFGLFALSDVFDTMFLDPNQSSITTDQNRKRVANLLWKGIVNPLRKNGVVRFESVMKMRNALEELGKMEGITEKEKDPEEFLNMLFKHMLHTKAFISIRRPFGVEQEFFVQLFVEHDPNLRVPTVGQLLRRMFKEQHISFTKLPSKLLLQVPRFGREFQTYKRIVPELKLDIRELTDTYKKAPAPACFICGEESAIKCENCGQQQITHYCQRCSDLYHSNPSHKDRANHRRTVAVVAATPADDPGLAQLDLLSVICIETSHYVCFTRDPRDDVEGNGKWIFFDSMADRKYDTYNIPRVTDCTRELNEWVYSDVRGRDKLFSTPPRELPELVRRFTQDVYMCVYVQPDVSLYGDADDVDED